MNTVNKASSNAIRLPIIAVGVTAAIALVMLTFFVISQKTDQPQNADPTTTQSSRSQNSHLDISEDDVKNKLPESRTLRQRRIADLQASLEKLSRPQRGDDRPARKRLKTFETLTGEEKNLLWWKIASVAATTQGEGTRYQLTTRQAMQISSEVGSSDLDVFKLFREGVDADWRTDAPPPEMAAEDEAAQKKS